MVNRSAVKTGLTGVVSLLGVSFSLLVLPLFVAGCSKEPEAKEILDETGLEGGLIVHVGCGNGEFTASLRASSSYIVHGLDTEPSNVDEARRNIDGLGLYGQVSVDSWNGKSLPYIDNLVNLLVVEDTPELTTEEALRVLVPNGVAYISREGNWVKEVKPRPNQIDEWTHYLHDSTGNAVANDSVVGPPRRFQWVGSPRWSRHHDHMSSVSALVSAGGRIFYVIDEAPSFSILVAPEWKLVARDAFNGTILWKRPIPDWHDHMHRLKSGPAELPRRLVAQGDRVYVTLGIEAAVTALDAATGEIVQRYDGSESTREILLYDNLLLLGTGGELSPSNWPRSKTISPEAFSAAAPDNLLAYEASSGKRLWQVEYPIVKLTLAMDGDKVVFTSKDQIICLDRSSGELQWESEPVSRAEYYPTRSAPTLVMHDDIILFAGSRLAAQSNRSWDTGIEDTLIALSAQDGTVLWKAPHPNSGYASPEDVLVADGVVWSGETSSGHAVGRFTGRDLHTGEVVSAFDPDVETYWFHHRCYRAKATDRFLMTSRSGIEFIDFRQEKWDINHWVRGACLYGVMPANGMTYAPQHPCACYPEAKMYGLNALAPGKRVFEQTGQETNRSDSRLERGPAFNVQIETSGSAFGSEEEWPTYRHDNSRSGRSAISVDNELVPLWKTSLGSKVSSPVIADSRLFVASIDDHQIQALDALSGEELWSFRAGGRIDSPPTIYKGRAFFGSADGYVYSLRAQDGALIWRFRAAPVDQRMMWFEQLESVWPVHGSVLIQDASEADSSELTAVLYFVAGRSMFLDGGMRMYRMDPITGEVLSETVLDERDPDGEGTIQDYARQQNMPVALPDILSSDGRFVYMRSQPFELNGKRIPLEAFEYAGDPQKYSVPPTQNLEHAHLFSPTGFLDDTWWHRSYWVFGSRFLGGWAGYSKAGKVTPGGKILVFDESRVYGFGRKPQYYSWSTPIEHQLFSAAKRAAPDEKGSSQERSAKRPNAFQVHHDWTTELPLMVRAMVMTGEKLLVAGPPDLVDEKAILSGLNSAEVLQQLSAQKAAFAGERGGSLWVVSARDGEKLSEIGLENIPIFDGMVAAYGRVYLSTTEGEVLCLAGTESEAGS